MNSKNYKGKVIKVNALHNIYNTNRYINIHYFLKVGPHQKN